MEAAGSLPRGTMWDVNGKRVFSCDQCDYRTQWKHNLGDHARIHSGSRPFTCEHCDKTFRKSSLLLDHRKIHSESRPFACEHCDKRFKTASNLRSHAWVHNASRLFSCELCAYRCNKRSSLLAHARAHTEFRPHPCEHCGKQFKSVWDTTKHARIHVDARTHKCEQCDSAFKRADTLATHMERIHDVGPHRCDYCLGNRNSRNALEDGAVHVCRQCYRRATGFGSLAEKEWAEYADIHLGTEGLISSDQALSSLGGCTTRRPDRLYGGPDLVELHEHDGTQHGSYTCEEKRITEIYDEPSISGKVMVVFRFNPDGYTTAYGEAKLTISERLEVYISLVKRVRAETRNADTPRIFVYYLFYSHDNPLIVKNIAHAFVASMADVIP
jgi:hypothetical protein